MRNDALRHGPRTEPRNDTRNDGSVRGSPRSWPGPPSVGYHPGRAGRYLDRIASRFGPHTLSAPVFTDSGIRDEVPQTPAIQNAGREQAAPHGRSPLACPESVLSTLTTVLAAAVGSPAFVLAMGRVAMQMSREVRLHRAESVALREGDEDPRGRAGLAITKALADDNEPWYLKALPWRKSDDGQS
jgi:hypothetical protein